MRNKSRIWERVLIYSVPSMMLASFFFQIGYHCLERNKYKDLGEGYSVREKADRRIFVFGNGRFGIDKNNDGTLDEIMINMPLSPMMGGPGWAPFKTPTTEEDRKKFERANYLLGSKK